MSKDITNGEKCFLIITVYLLLPKCPIKKDIRCVWLWHKVIDKYLEWGRIYTMK